MFEEYVDAPLPTGLTPSVSDINRYLKNLIGNDYGLKNLTIKGEISNFTNHIKTGHFYFSLKDKTSSIKAIMFKTNACKVKFNVENGMNVIVRGSVSVFERDGIFQFYCEEMLPDGIGALSLAFEQLKVKLEKAGLFDEAHKKPIPKMPTNIGVVTSANGAALQDIIKIIGRRYPIAKITVISALVQGDGAPKSIVAGIKLAQTHKDIDVLIIGRGGGSTEDLWGFNDETVARAIYDCKIPTISAVGHEVDTTISDYVADRFASTPSAAAEICTPSIDELNVKLNDFAFRIESAYKKNLQNRNENLLNMQSRLNSLSPKNKLEQENNKISTLQNHLKMAMDSVFNVNSNRLMAAIEKLEVLNPVQVITRGFSITRRNDKIINSIDEVEAGVLIETKIKDGVIVSQVLQTRKDI